MAKRLAASGANRSALDQGLRSSQATSRGFSDAPRGLGTGLGAATKAASNQPSQKSFPAGTSACRLATEASGEAEVDTAITRERFEAYLRDRFSDPTLTVTEFRPLAGGFGKQTILLAVTGTALDGKLAAGSAVSTSSSAWVPPVELPITTGLLTASA